MYKKWSPTCLAQISDDQIIRDWTLLEQDKKELKLYHKKFRRFIAIQFCALRLFGRFIQEPHVLPPSIISYLSKQLKLNPTIEGVLPPKRKATRLEQQKAILNYLKFQLFNKKQRIRLEKWVEQKIKQGAVAKTLISQAEHFLFTHQILLPAPTTIERIIVHVGDCRKVGQNCLNWMHYFLSPF